MDSKQPQVDHRQPQEKHCPNAPPEAQEAAQAAALGEQEPSEGTHSRVPPLQSSYSPPGPSSAQTHSGQRSLLATPEPEEEAWADEEENREVCHPLEPCRGERHMEQEHSQGEANKLSQEDDNNSDKSSVHENYRRITIHTIWVNPKYPELFQEEAQAAAPSASEQQVPAAGAQSPVSDSPCCSLYSSRTQLAAQTLRDPQGAHRQPASSRRALQALCTLLWCSCMEVQLGD